MDQRRVMLAVALSLGVVLAYNELVIRPRQRSTGTSPATRVVPTEQTGTTSPPEVPPPSGEDNGKLSFEVGSSAPIVVETDVWQAKITPQGGRLTSLVLKGFRQTVDPDSPPLELVEEGPLLPLTLDLGVAGSDAEVHYQSDTPPFVRLSDDASGDIVLTGTTTGGLQIRKGLHFQGNSYLIDVDVSVTGPGAPAAISLIAPELDRKGLRGSGRSGQEVAVALSQGKLTETTIDESKIQALKVEPKTNALWIGFSVQFFVGALIAPDEPFGIATVEPLGSRPIVRMERSLRDGKTSFKVFMGPKAKEVLADAGFDLGRTLDFGWFWFIAIPMLYALRSLHRLTGNYGLDIILLTALVRAVTIPLTQKSFRSMKEMQKLQPQLKRIQEQYKDDQTRLQKEMMELYKRHGVNPFGGCAPMVLQVPIFVGLYNALLHAIELRHAPFALWITDLSAPERLVVAGVGIPVLTLVMGGTMILQQWITPQQGDPTQRQMMMIMPIVFTFMFFNFPSGLVLYWLVSNVLGIAQQYLMLKVPK